MLLSTSNFKRQIPQGNWIRLFLVSLLITLALVGIWEGYVRNLGYEASLNDNADLWAETRTKLDHSAPNRTVIVGASRSQFDFDLKTYADYFGVEEPIQLALYGSNPVPVLEHIAFETNVSGTVLVGVTPVLLFIPEGEGPVDRSRDTIKHYQNWSISQKTDYQLWKPLDTHLAFLQEEDFRLSSLIKSLNIPNRSSSFFPPKAQPYFNTVQSNRQASIWDKMDAKFAERIQKGWLPYFTPPPPPPNVTQEEFEKIFKDNMESYLQRIAKAVAAIQKRGGKVVFIRYPSAGKIRELEAQFTPRNLFWDQIIAVSGAHGIHFEDYAELSGFQCPEWSHLSKKDAILFTQNLMPILKRLLRD